MAFVRSHHTSSHSKTSNTVSKWCRSRSIASGAVLIVTGATFLHVSLQETLTLIYTSYTRKLQCCPVVNNVFKYPMSCEPKIFHLFFKSKIAFCNRILILLYSYFQKTYRFEGTIPPLPPSSTPLLTGIHPLAYKQLLGPWSTVFHSSGLNLQNLSFQLSPLQNFRGS